MPDKDTITDEMRSFIGLKTDPKSYIVEKHSVEYFATAIGDQNKLYFDEEYAKEKVGGLLAPPTFIRKFKPNKLEKNFIIFDYLTNDEIMALYLKCKALIMPTYVARSTLPLYEAFYFKIPVIYSKDILDKKLEEFVITVDLNNPKDLSDKLMKFDSLNNETNSKKLNAHSYFMKYCTDEKKLEIIKNTLDEFYYTSKRWL